NWTHASGVISISPCLIILFVASILRKPSPLGTVLFCFNDPATTVIYTLSLHDALPICVEHVVAEALPQRRERLARVHRAHVGEEIGRAACRERGWVSAGGMAV